MTTERFACPCCGYKTYTKKPNGDFDICPVCFWEDDPIQFKKPDYEGGANVPSLRQAQRNFMEFGAYRKDRTQYVRKPTEDEQRDDNWKPLE